jgi:hypothetical protein
MIFELMAQKTIRFFVKADSALEAENMASSYIEDIVEAHDEPWETWVSGIIDKDDCLDGIADEVPYSVIGDQHLTIKEILEGK